MYDTHDHHYLLQICLPVVPCEHDWCAFNAHSIWFTLDAHWKQITSFMWTYLKKQSASIPKRFITFNGYNLPQLPKHRKWQSLIIHQLSSNHWHHHCFKIFEHLFGVTCLLAIFNSTLMHLLKAWLTTPITSLHKTRQWNFIMYYHCL